MSPKEAIVVCCNLCCQPSAVICVGCDRYFCLDHYNEHRSAMEKCIDDVRKRHSSICQCLAEFEPVEKELRGGIEKWKNDSIESVQLAAEKANAKLNTIVKNQRAQFEEASMVVIQTASTNSDAQLIQIEKELTEYGDTLKSIHLVSHNAQKIMLELRSTHPKDEKDPTESSVRVGPYQAGVFEPQSILGKRLTNKPSAETDVGNYWTIGGSDTHLIVQEYETNQLKMFDRYGKRDISMTWYYRDVIRDIQWHDRSRRFFILLDTRLFTFDSITKNLNPQDEVTPYQSNRFRRCTCLDDRMFISYWGRESAIELFQISSWTHQQRWSSPITCRANELITCIRLSPKEQLALSIEDENDPTNRLFRVELRDLMLNTLHIIQLHADLGIFSRMTPLPDGCWAVVNVDGNHVYVLSEHGELVEKVDCNQEKLLNIALIGEKTVVIRKTDKLLFYDVDFTQKNQCHNQ